MVVAVLTTMTITAFAVMSSIFYMLGLNGNIPYKMMFANMTGKSSIMAGLSVDDMYRTMNVMRFFNAFRFVESEYVDNVTQEQLLNGAIEGMLHSLGDPHSDYLEPQTYRDLMNHTEGTFGGIGVVMGMQDKEIVVISPIAGTPGDAAGLKTGDKIVKINDEDTAGMSIEQAATKIRGESGTQVVLTIRRAGTEDRAYEITRSVIAVQTAAGQMLEDNIGYIRIAAFSENTAQEVRKVYDELVQQGMRAVILDLRNNPGGLLNSSVDIANLFVPKGVVVSTVKRNGEREVFTSNLERVPYPAVALINGGSASASEIVAGALQDTGAATIVGTKSYGKGSVQIVLPLYGGDAMKLTVAKYYTPNDRSIEGTGIEPDVTVELDGESDTQLKKALEILKDKIAAAASGDLAKVLSNENKSS